MYLIHDTETDVDVKMCETYDEACDNVMRLEARDVMQGKFSLHRYAICEVLNE